MAEGETADPATYAGEAFDAWFGDEGGADAFAPLPVDEARAAYVAAFVRAVAELGGASGARHTTLAASGFIGVSCV